VISSDSFPVVIETSPRQCGGQCVTESPSHGAAHPFYQPNYLRLLHGLDIDFEVEDLTGVWNEESGRNKKAADSLLLPAA
jgi:hypothetical protein